MKKIEYTCNLCWDKKEPKEIKCFFWVCDAIPQHYELVDDVNKSDKHICNDCIKIIREII